MYSTRKSLVINPQCNMHVCTMTPNNNNNNNTLCVIYRLRLFMYYLANFVYSYSSHDTSETLRNDLPVSFILL